MLNNSAFFRILWSAVLLIFFFSVTSAYYVIERLFKKVGVPCFDVIDYPECQTSLPESFESTYPKYGSNEPDTLVYLFTPEQPDVAEQLHSCGGRLRPNTTYDTKCETEVIIHGWIDGLCRSAWMREMKEQLLQREAGCYNVILIDWTWGNFPQVFGASKNSKIVGDQVGFILNNIMEQTGVGPEMFHIVGHSMGGVLAGFIGRRAKGLRRITALDPTVLPEKDAAPNERLTFRDAEIVDVIHTSARDCRLNGAGDSRAMGHADFYPNGGETQSNCSTNVLISLLKHDVLYGLLSLLPQICSHLTSIQYYKSSINSNGCQLVGIAAESYSEFQNRAEDSPVSRDEWAVMGMDYENYLPTNVTAGTRYFLDTSPFCPYYDNSHLGENTFPFETSCSA